MSSYTELIKNFEKIRDYIREFYIYGFKSREEFNKKSSRSYDDEKRRIESYLEGYMGFRNSKSGKRIFINIDSRKVKANPLYRALKSKSFTDNDITLHFILMDIFVNNSKLSVSEIKEKIYINYLSYFDIEKSFDDKTIANKLNEYVKIGLLSVEKIGKQNIYDIVVDKIELSKFKDIILFFSEVGFCGVIGSYLLDKLDNKDSSFIFKHHYIVQAIDSEVLYKLFDAMSNKESIIISNYTRHSNVERKIEVIPIKIFVSVQSGRQYLIAYNNIMEDFRSYRLDYITKVKEGNVVNNFNKLRRDFAERVQGNMWGVVCNKNHMQHIEFTINIDEDELYILDRLRREKRCGSIEKIDDNTYKFKADVFDASEVVTWIRTFICRIKDIHFSSKALEDRFKKDIKDMYKLYDIE